MDEIFWLCNLEHLVTLHSSNPRLRKVRGTYTVEKSHRWRYHRIQAAKLRAPVTAPSIGRIKQKERKLQPPPSARVVSHTSVAVRGVMRNCIYLKDGAAGRRCGKRGERGACSILGNNESRTSSPREIRGRGKE